MPNISVQLRRGTDTEHSSFTGAEGEVTVDTTNDTLRVHDGTTAGGIRLAKLSEASGSGTVTSVDSGTGLTGGPITTSGTLSLASIANSTVLGNVSGASAAPVAVDIKDEDAMTSDSNTALATQQSIKAYVDSQIGFNPSTYTGQESVTFPNGMIMKMGEVSSTTSTTTITFASAFPNGVVSVIASSIKNGAANNDSDANISNVSTSGFTVSRVTGTGGHTGIYWQAIGR